MAAKFDVLAAGSYGIDLIFTGLPAFPRLGVDTLATGFEMTPGEAFISVAVMHRLGLKVGWAADFGNDEYSQYALRAARKEGLDETLFIHHARPFRRISVSISFPEERGFVSYYDPDPPLPAAFKALPTTSARLFFLPGLYYGKLMDAGLLMLRARGMQLAMDGNSSEGELSNNPALQKSLKNTHLFLPNAAEARRLTGESTPQAAARSLAGFAQLVVVKDGSNGAYACSGDDRYYEPSLPITPLDTTGAGDNFNAGFIKAWLDGLPIQQCLRWGNIVGGLSTLARGGTTRRISPEEVKRYLVDPSAVGGKYRS